MPTWPYRPRDTPSERLAWRTDVIRCHSAEYRARLRDCPRVVWDHAYILDARDYADALDFCKANAAATVDVPEWNSLVDIPATTAGTVVLSIAGADTMPAYAAGGKAILWESNSSFEVVSVTGVSGDSVSISATTRNHNKSTAAPLRACVFDKLLESDREPAIYVRATAAFGCDVTEDLTPTYGSGIAYPDYLGSPVVADRVEMLSGVREAIDCEVQTLDSVVGMVDRRAVYATAGRAFMLAWYCPTRADVWNLRRWLHSRKGQQKNFWSLSWTPDVQITGDIVSGTTSIEIEAIGFASKRTLPCDFAVVVKRNGGVYLFRVVGASSGSPGRELLTLSEPLACVPLSAQDIELTCKITLSRFATDEVEIQHLPGGQATIAVSIVEDPNTP
jgi:hypothetical protein